MKYYTYKKAAEAVARVTGQVVRFTVGKGYWLFGKPRPAPITVMFDSVTISEIPAHARAVAGYVGGQYPTYPKLAVAFPHAKRLSIAVNAGQNAECLDIEKGDAVYTDAPSWFRRQRVRGVRKPVFYVQLSNAQQLVNYLRENKIQRSSYRLWTAHYTGREHVCNAGCGFGLLTTADATQWTNQALGRNLDQSRVDTLFFS